MVSRLRVGPGQETTLCSQSGKYCCWFTLIFSPSITRKGGLNYLGQDQDSLGGDFNPRQSWSGLITQFNIWNWALEDYFIENAAECRSDLLGNVMTWKADHYFLGKVSFTNKLVILSKNTFRKE